MKPSRSHSVAPPADRAAKNTRRSASGAFPPRLKAVPWTRFLEEVQARLESGGEITLRHLGTLRSVRDEPAVAFAESEPTVEDPETASRNEQSTGDRAHD